MCTNALKYAFPDGGSGTIAVRLSAEVPDPSAGGAPSLVEVSVSDDGIGLGGLSRPVDAGGFGYLLVEALCGQLRGELRIESERGTTVRIRCPLEPG